MTKTPFFATVLTLSLVVTSTAQADPIDQNTAREALFHPERVEVVRYQSPGLTDDEISVLTQVAQTQKYYAALAFAPDAGIMAEPTVLSANYHTIEAAREAALSGCNARRSGGAECTIALEVRPAGWEARAFQLSGDATAAFNSEYRRLSGPRAFAISPSSGQWGIGRGENASDAAISGCRGDSEVSDCVTVIAD